MTVEWHGDAAMDHVRRNAVQFLTRAAIEVTRRAKQLLSVSGTGMRSSGGGSAGGGGGGGGSAAKPFSTVKARKAFARSFVKSYNARNKLGISLGKIKKLRVTKSGLVSERKKARKFFYHNVGGKMVRSTKPPKPKG